MKQSDVELLRIIWEYMAVQMPLRHADVIIAGGCKDPGVATFVAELFHLGLAPLIVFSGYKQPGMEMTEADFFTKIAHDHGVPDSAIVKEQKASNTGENIRFSQALLAEHNITPQTVILVHKPYMSRRFLATAEAQWQGPPPTFIARHETTSFAEYFAKHERVMVFRKTLGDFQRLRPYAKKGYQSPQVIPDTVQQAYDTLLQRGHKTR